MQSIEDIIGEIAAASSDEADDVIRAIFSRLREEFPQSISSLMSQVASEAIEAETADDLLYEALSEAHTRAAYLGRRLAGNDVAFGDYDRAYGSLVADEQIQYAEGFVEAIQNGDFLLEDGTIDTDAVERRANLYNKRLRGTANESWANALPVDEPVYWVQGNTEQSCGTCEGFANDSPYKPHELPTHPGAGATECSIGCDCTLRSESGQTGF